MEPLSGLPLDVLGAGPSIEERVDALELAHLAVDELHAHSLRPGLRVIGERLTGITALAGLRLACHSLEEEIALGGAQAMVESTFAFPASDPAAQLSSAVAALLLAFPEDPLMTLLAADLTLFGEAALSVSEALLPALLHAAESASDLSAVDAARSGLIQQTSAVAASPRSRRITPRYAVVRSGQELPDIAQMLYGDAEQWPRLIDAYQLYPPYLSETSQPGRLTPGQRLLLPPDPEDAEAQGLGITLALDVRRNPNGGQLWDIIAQDGQGLATDQGLPAFATDLALRLATPLGSLDGEDNYGVTPVAGLPASLTGIYAAVVAAETLKEDARVLKVVFNPAGSSAISGVLVGGVLVVPRPELLEG